MSRQLLIDYLERRHARFIRENQIAAYTAADIAESGDVHCPNFAKVVMVKVNGELAMAVIPAHCYLHLDALKADLGAASLELAREREFNYRFPRCEPGAMPPFGHLYGLQTYLVPLFDDTGEIAFNAGICGELVRMPYEEYLQLAYADVVSPEVATPSPSAVTNLRYVAGKIGLAGIA